MAKEPTSKLEIKPEERALVERYFGKDVSLARIPELVPAIRVAESLMAEGYACGSPGGALIEVYESTKNREVIAHVIGSAVRLTQPNKRLENFLSLTGMQFSIRDRAKSQGQSSSPSYACA